MEIWKKMWVGFFLNTVYMQSEPLTSSSMDTFLCCSLKVVASDSFPATFYSDKCKTFAEDIYW